LTPRKFPGEPNVSAEQQLAKEGREELIKLYSTDVDNCKKKIAEL